jgi:hypothetical protein
MLELNTMTGEIVQDSTGICNKNCFVASKEQSLEILGGIWFLAIVVFRTKEFLWCWSQWETTFENCMLSR